ncbi:MAG: N-acetylmuramoyl-L-alanine amidase, partial [Myxococcales bacterium]|nr:N-acetylmuramoyl-L-alanine amidase [Myxococcales bacterium]
WRAAIAAYGGGGADGARYADEVFARMRYGWTGRDAAGAEVTLSAIDVAAAPGDDGFGTVTQGVGYPGAIWNPASTSNYQAASRGAGQINYVVIHTTQGSYSGTISWFKNPQAQVSSHYVVRSSDGQVTQMVDDTDIAWHDACFNSQTIGIEHEGFVADPDVWYTEAMYTESAKLTAWLADRYGIPKTRDYIFGHGEAPDCSDHTDPGAGWDWNHYMALVQTGGQPQFGAASGAAEFPSTMVSGEEAVVWFEFANQSNVTWGLDETRLGTQEPQDRASPFYVEGNWLSPSRPTGADHSNYAPGSTGRFTFAIRAPEVTEPTTFDEAYALVQEGVTWFGPTVHMTITVLPRDGATDPDPGADPIGDGPDQASDGSHSLDGTAEGGCSTGGAGGGGGFAFGLAALVAVRRRRPRSA